VSTPSPTSPVTVHRFVPFDRSGRVAWMLEELGVDYETRDLDFRKGENKTPEYLAISPTGKVPGVTVGETRLFESAACMQLLGELHGKLVPPPGDPERAEFLCWMTFATATLDPTCFEFVRPDLAEEERPPRQERARKEVRKCLRALEAQLGDRETLLPSGFSAADIQVAACLHYAAADEALEDFPKLAAYLEAMKARPAARKAGIFPPSKGEA